MSKLKLIAKVLSVELKEPGLTEDNAQAKIAEAIRSFAVESLNQYAFFRERNVDDNTLKEIMQQNDLDFNLKTRKFFLLWQPPTSIPSPAFYERDKRK